MSGKKRFDASSRKRIAVICSDQQKLLIEEAAKRLGCDASSLILSYTLRGIGALAADGKAKVEAAPVIVNGKIGARLRERADQQGVPPERMLELLLVGGG